MESNLPSPYEVVETEDFDYIFVTKDGIVYRAYFLDVSYLHPQFHNSYSFSIEPIGDKCSTIHSIDRRIGITIASILEKFFKKNENSMLMACDNTDGKEDKRRKLFDRWYDTYSNNSLVRLDAALENDVYRLHVSMYIGKNNPRREQLISAFNELIKTDLYELCI